MVILIFQRDLCSPPSFPLCPVGRSTAAKMLSLLSGIPLVVFLFLLAMDSTASPLPTSAWKAGITSLALFQTRRVASKKPTRGFFFLKLFVLFIFISTTETKLLLFFFLVEYKKDIKGLAVKQGSA